MDLIETTKNEEGGQHVHATYHWLVKKRHQGM
jgi:hypothetical protein